MTNTFLSNCKFVDDIPKSKPPFCTIIISVLGVEFDLNLEPGVVSDIRIVVMSKILSNKTDLVVVVVVVVVVVDIVVVVVVAIVVVVEVVVVVAAVVVVEVVGLGAFDDVVLVVVEVVDLPFNLIKTKYIYFQKFQISTY